LIGLTALIVVARLRRSTVRKAYGLQVT